ENPPDTTPKHTPPGQTREPPGQSADKTPPGQTKQPPGQTTDKTHGPENKPSHSVDHPVEQPDIPNNTQHGTITAPVR
ncbi:hypothetical protein, partial [Nonomuraea cavernae]